MSRYDSAHRESRTDFRRPRLNQYFVKGEGINYEVLQNEICRYLGPEAYARLLVQRVSRLVILQSRIC